MLHKAAAAQLLGSNLVGGVSCPLSHFLLSSSENLLEALQTLAKPEHYTLGKNDQKMSFKIFSNIFIFWFCFWIHKMKNSLKKKPGIFFRWFGLVCTVQAPIMYSSRFLVRGPCKDLDSNSTFDFALIGIEGRAAKRLAR